MIWSLVRLYVREQSECDVETQVRVKIAPMIASNSESPAVSRVQVPHSAPDASAGRVFL